MHVEKELLNYLKPHELAELEILLREEFRIKRLDYHDGQLRVWDGRKRFNVLACGRRFGKTEMGMDLAIDGAQSGGPIGWFSPTFNMMGDVWRDMEETLIDVITSKNKQERYMLLDSGGQIDYWSLDNADMARGRKYARVIVDEAAMVPGLEYAWHNVIRPTLTDLEGDAWFMSTPKGRNFFWRIYQLGQDPDNPYWRSWQLATSANPYIKSSEIAAARDQLPEVIFEQEYLAEFLEGQGAVFRNITANLTAPETTPAAHDGHHIVAGLDWARQQDFTAISVGCATCKQELTTDRFNKIEYAFQRDRVKALCERWGVVDLLAEENSIGGPNLEMLQREGLPVRGFQTTASSKSPLIQNLALSLEKEEFEFIDDPVWTGELEAYEQKVSPTTGRASYNAPEGLHDDCVIARALMLRAVHTGGLEVY